MAVTLTNTPHRSPPTRNDGDVAMSADTEIRENVIILTYTEMIESAAPTMQSLFVFNLEPLLHNPSLPKR